MLVLFGVGYLAVDLFVAPGVVPARQQNSVAPTVEGQPAADPTQLKAEQGTADPQPGPQTGKSEARPAEPGRQRGTAPGSGAAAGQAAHARDLDR